MTVRTYLLGMAVSTILCFVSWVFIVVYVDPVRASLVGVALFYLTLFFFLAGFFALAGYGLRRRIFSREVEFVQVETSFRQGVLLSLASVGALALQSLRMLVWWDALLLIFGVGLLELYFAGRK